MARKVVVTLVDDFDGTSIAEDTVAFEIDGAAYEIDLSDDNAAKLRATFDQWLPYARRTGRIKASVRRSEAKAAAGASQQRRNDHNAIRAWASNNGHPVSTRGRIAAEIVAAYDKASA
ncbi:histone-like nucleoid-structuring protein Lsr2 [Nocardia fluminea]|uniref:histone-like nucleoid-structuring protein Lsr2 n=1 Tax=Nocardia fluminea TaxID=134984 RepID=UPI0036655CBF